MLVRRFAARSVSSRWISPMTTCTPSRRANATPAACGSRSMATTLTPRSCSWPTTRMPTRPSPTTITWPLGDGRFSRSEPVSRAPTIRAVTNGTNTIPSKVRMNCATFSGPPRAGSVTAAPAASSMVRYSAFGQAYPAAVASSTNPATAAANRAANPRPSRCQTSPRSICRAVRTGSRRRASGLRGVPSAMASTRSAFCSSGGSSRGSVEPLEAASPHSTWPGSASSRRATYRVRPDTRTWLGAGSPKAAAVKEGADIAVPTRTAQSGKNARTWSPRPGLNTARTSRISGFSSRARSAA